MSMKSAKGTDAVYTVPKLLEKILNPALPQLTYSEIVDKSDFLGGEGLEILVPCNIIDI